MITNVQKNPNSLSLQEFKEALLNHLTNWETASLALEEEYCIPKKEISPSDKRFLQLLGDAVYNLHAFYNRLLSRMDSGIYASGIVQKGSEAWKCYNMVYFLNNMLAARTKHLFFRENPPTPENLLRSSIHGDIARLGRAIVEKLALSVTEEVYFYVGKHFYLQSLLYSFIYQKNGEENQALFLRFEYHKNKGKTIIEKLLGICNELKTINDIRYLGLYAFALICKNESQDESNAANQNVIDAIGKIDKRACYKDLYQRIKDEKTKLDPYAYYLAVILWKIYGIIQEDHEYEMDDDWAEHEKDLKEVIKKFAIDYLEAVQEMYEREKVEYEKLVNISSSFFIKLYDVLLTRKNQDIFDEHSRTQMLNRLEKLQQEISEIKKERQTYNKEIEFKHVEMNKLIKQLSSSSLRNYKIETLVEEIKSEEILSILYEYAHFIEDNLNTIIKKGDIAKIGFYTSGTFLGHITNIFILQRQKEAQLYPIHPFKGKPYCAIQPRHEHFANDEPSPPQLCIFDDCIRTGFTLSLYRAFSMRNAEEDKTLWFFPLFEYEYFRKYRIQEGNLTKDIHPFCIIPENKTESTQWKYYHRDLKEEIPVPTVFSYNRIERADVRRLIEAIKYRKDEEKEKATTIDLSYLLSNTEVLFAISDLFREQIERCVNNTGKQICNIITASSEGKLLALVTGFLVKISSNNRIKVRFAKSHEELQGEKEYLQIAVDLSVRTGFSLAYALCKTLNQNSFTFDQREQSVNAQLKNYDMICSIIRYKSFPKTGKDNVYALYEL
ncbi:MAG: hypothetical protein LBU39_07750 [Desulfobulbaceae bacterium]|jgi:hypothetical protein|nr:hypothetical protein [Desulfobulbaceae bacterium]